MSLLEDLGRDAVAERILDNTAYLLGQLADSKNFGLVTPTAPERHAGIVSFKPLKQNVQETHRRLQTAGVVCAVRAGAVRFSPHFYTPREQLTHALELLDIN